MSWILASDGAMPVSIIVLSGEVRIGSLPRPPRQQSSVQTNSRSDFFKRACRWTRAIVFIPTTGSCNFPACIDNGGQRTRRSRRCGQSPRESCLGGLSVAMGCTFSTLSHPSLPICGYNIQYWSSDKELLVWAVGGQERSLGRRLRHKCVEVKLPASPASGSEVARIPHLWNMFEETTYTIWRAISGLFL